MMILKNVLLFLDIDNKNWKKNRLKLIFHWGILEDYKEYTHDENHNNKTLGERRFNGKSIGLQQFYMIIIWRKRGIEFKDDKIYKYKRYRWIWIRYYFW